MVSYFEEMRLQQQQEQTAQYDGRGFAWNTLAAMGLTPGDMKDIMKEIFENGDQMFLGQQAKGTTVEERSHNIVTLDPEEARMEAERLEATQRQEEQRLETARLNQQQFDQKKWEQEQRDIAERQEQERLDEQHAARNRPAEDATNNRILEMPFLAAGALFGMYLGADAIQTAGAAMSPHVDSLPNPALVTSNNNGGMFAAALEATGNTVSPGVHALVNGPNMASVFTPGSAPDLGGDDMDMGFGGPKQQPGMIPGMSMKPSGTA